MTETGHGTQVVKVLDDHSYQLDEEVLKQVLMKEEIKDLPVVVVSVAGAYRGGKSFLLNFFLRYLTSPQSARQDGSWLGEDSEPLAGFSWRGGVKRNTTGILLWSEPITVTLPSGEKVVVLLMDTQGTFDSKSTVRDNSTIFALSTLISSVQIFNLSMNIQEDDLQHLQLFTSYGKMIQENQNGDKAFQTLEFLVRDWPYPYDYAFGADGGSRLLQERLEITDDLPKELRDLRTHIQSSFEKVLCFLMPHPGFKVQSPTFKGNISDIDTNFRVHLIELVSSLLSPEKLSFKIINGQKVKAGELFNYFKTYMTLFNSDEIPSPISIMQATIEASLLSSMNEARGVYEQGMDSECGSSKPAVSLGDLQDLHHKHLAAAQAVFTKKRTMASQNDINKYLDKLNKELEYRLPQFEQSNLSKIQTVINEAQEVYNKLIRNVGEKVTLCLHPLDLDKVHQEAVQGAMTYYDSSVKNISKKPDLKRVELIQSLQGQYVQLKIINDKNNRDAVKNMESGYWSYMENKSVNPPISDAAFQQEHEKARSIALNNFQTRRNRPSPFPNDIYKADLDKAIMNTFWQLQKINHSKIEQENKRQEQERIKEEQDRQRIEQERIKAEQEHIRAEQQRIALEQEIERQKIASQQQAPIRIIERRSGGGGCNII